MAFEVDRRQDLTLTFRGDGARRQAERAIERRRNLVADEDADAQFILQRNIEEAERLKEEGQGQPATPDAPTAKPEATDKPTPEKDEDRPTAKPKADDDTPAASTRQPKPERAPEPPQRDEGPKTVRAKPEATRTDAPERPPEVERLLDVAREESGLKGARPGGKDKVDFKAGAAALEQLELAFRQAANEAGSRKETRALEERAEDVFRARQRWAEITAQQGRFLERGPEDEGVVEAAATVLPVRLPAAVAGRLAGATGKAAGTTGRAVARVIAKGGKPVAERAAKEGLIKSTLQTLAAKGSSQDLRVVEGFLRTRSLDDLRRIAIREGAEEALAPSLSPSTRQGVSQSLKSAYLKVFGRPAGSAVDEQLFDLSKRALQPVAERAAREGVVKDTLQRLAAEGIQSQNTFRFVERKLRGLSLEEARKEAARINAVLNSTNVRSALEGLSPARTRAVKEIIMTTPSGAAQTALLERELLRLGLPSTAARRVAVQATVPASAPVTRTRTEAPPHIGRTEPGAPMLGDQDDEPFTGLTPPTRGQRTQRTTDTEEAEGVTPELPPRDPETGRFVPTETPTEEPERISEPERKVTTRTVPFAPPAVTPLEPVPERGTPPRVEPGTTTPERPQPRTPDEKRREPKDDPRETTRQTVFTTTEPDFRQREVERTTTRVEPATEPVQRTETSTRTETAARGDGGRRVLRDLDLKDRDLSQPVAPGEFVNEVGWWQGVMFRTLDLVTGEERAFRDPPFATPRRGAPEETLVALRVGKRRPRFFVDRMGVTAAVIGQRGRSLDFRPADRVFKRRRRP